MQCVINVYLSRCMHIEEGAGVPVEVADIYCDPVVQPPDLNACHVACPGTCVLGPWSDWSDCPQVCTIVFYSQMSLCLECTGYRVVILPMPLGCSASLGKGAVLPPNYTQTDTTEE